MIHLKIISVQEDILICLTLDNKSQKVDIEGIIILFEEGDQIVHIEHGFCDVYRNGEVIGGISNLFTRLIQ